MLTDVHVHLMALALSGSAIRRLMRVHQVTIRGLARKHGLTMKRVREVRAAGTKPGFASSEWHWMITGQWFEDLSSQAAEALAASMPRPVAELVSLTTLCNEAQRHVE